MQTNPRLNIRQVAWAHPVGADLRRAQQAELDARFGTADHEPGPPPSGADCAVFLVAYDKGSGQPVGGGGLAGFLRPAVRFPAPSREARWHGTLRMRRRRGTSPDERFRRSAPITGPALAWVAALRPFPPP